MAGVKVNGTKLDDNIFIDAGDDTIKAGNGNDTIYAGGGNDVITGGKGDNVITLTNIIDSKAGFGNDIVNLTKGENLVIDCKDYSTLLDVKIDGKNIVLTFSDSESVTLKNFASKDVVGSNGSVKLKLKDVAELVDLKDFVFAGGEFNKKGVYSGKWLSEVIDASDITTAFDKKGVKGVTVKAGAGDDEVTGSKFNDTITGGVGNNVINIDLNKDFGNDTIVLTKNENLEINITGAAQYGASFLKQYSTSVDGKDFIVKFYSDVEQTTELGSIRLKDFASKNVVGENGSVVIRIDELKTKFDLTDEIFTINGVNDSVSKMLLYSNDEGITSWVNKGTINGTRLGEDFWAADIETAYDKKGTKGVTINAGGGDDRATGSKFNDKINGGDGDDSLEGYGGNDTLYGGKGNDYLCADAGDDKLYGEAGEDTLYGGTGNDTLYGGDGNDEIYAGKDNDFVYGGKGDDLLKGGDGTDKLYGDKGNDSLYGGVGKDSLYGGDGDDEIVSGEWAKPNDEYDYTVVDDSDNLLDGGKGHDWLNAGAGNDTLKGGDGNDTLFAGDGNNLLDGGKGEDWLLAGAGTSTLKGGAGVDLLESDDKGTNNLLYAGAGDDSIEARGTGDIAYGEDGNDQINLYNDSKKTAYGGKGNDFISIQNGQATVYGEAGNDTIQGGKTSASDIVFAKGGGNDVYINRGAIGDTLVFDNISASALSFKEVTHNRPNRTWVWSDEVNDYVLKVEDVERHELIIEYGKNQSVIVEDYYKDGSQASTADIYIETKDGGKVLLSDLLTASANGTLGTSKADKIETSSGGLYITSDGNDTISVSGANATIYAGAGKDTITATGADSVVYGGKGNDVITTMDYTADNLVFANGDGHDTVINEIHSWVTNPLPGITAERKTDNIELTGVNKNGFIQKVVGNDLVILYNADKQGEYQDSITLKDYLKDVEDMRSITITTKDGIETTTDVEALKADVASWLSSTGFADVETGLASGTEEQVAELVAVFEQANWQATV